MDIREMLKRHEGLRLKPYRCSKNKRTIGYGWNLDAHPLPDDYAACLRLTGEITDEMADRLLTISICNATDDCRDIYKGFNGFTETRRFALIDFMFNLGATTALEFKKMRAAIKEGDWQRAADEMHDSDWYTQVGSRSAELIGMVRNG